MIFNVFLILLIFPIFSDTSLKTEENEDEAKIEPEMTDLSRYFRTPSNELNLTLLNEAFKASSHSSSVLVGLEYRDVVFLSENNSIIASHVGATVVIPCRVKKESNFGMISWARRQKDSYQILTIAESTHVNDPRFLIANSMPIGEDWSIQISRLTLEDEGVYECQANSHPPQFISATLKVEEAYAKIKGPSEKFIKAGSELLLNCTFHRLTHPPAFIFWYRNDRMVNQDRGLTVRITPEYSTLRIENASYQAANYTCSPENAKPASVQVHVISEAYNSAAAMENNVDSASSSSSCSPRSCHGLIITAIVLIIMFTLHNANESPT